ncbi:unnamed protein product [Heterobilharzia americana]|nr:unnamed protein product [Heterobilharzia americana]
MLELIRTKGFGAVKLDTDYVFFPSAPDLQPVYTRRRPLSSSSDGSLPRVMGLERIRREVSNEPKNHSFNTKLNENLDNHQKSEHSVWTDIMNNPEVESNTIATTNTPNSSSITMPRNRPRTWHHLPGHNSLVMSSLLPKDKSDYGIHNENGDETENDNFTNDNNHHFNSLSSRTSGIPVNQSMLNTCWCATKSMRLPIHHSLGYSSSLSSSPVGINPNPHIVVNQMKLSPYTTVDERYLLGGNANVTNQLHKQMDAPYSTPVSPTPFILGEPMNRNKIHNCKMNVHQTLVSSQTATKLEISRTPEICASERFYTINNTEQKPEINGRLDHLSKILREISNCLHTNPQYPVVIMPTYNMLSSSGNEQTNDTNNKATPLVFQIPHSDSVFVGLPATSGVNPRVMTASPTNAVVILPSVSTNEIMQQSTSQQHQDYLPSSGTQPTILTGPKQGYLLIITPDNKYEYVPRS